MPEDDPRPADAPPRRRRRRTWPQRLVLGVNVVLVVACLAAAGALLLGQNNLEDVRRVNAVPDAELAAPIPSMVVDALGGPLDTTVPPDPNRPIAAVATEAKNYLLAGSDSRDCVDPGAADAGARSDTIMVLRVEPETGRVAILSFPRDLWVPIVGSSREGKLNSAFDPTDPTRLIGTIEAAFGVSVDHYVSIDFCGFRDMVDAVGGVGVPFLTPVRDAMSGLQIDATGCVELTGETALAYVRSRHLEYQGTDGTWREERSADIGRIRRQQDFLRRLLHEVRSRGSFDIGLIRGLLDTLTSKVAVDLDLTADDVLDLVDAMADYDPDTTRNFIIEGTVGFRGTASVVEPEIDNERMQAILDIFRGKAPIGERTAPEASAPGDPVAEDNPDVGVDITEPPAGVVVDNVTSAYGASESILPDPNVLC